VAWRFTAGSQWVCCNQDASREQASGPPGIDHRNRWIFEVSHVSRRDRGVLSERDAGDLNIANVELPPSLPIRGGE